MIFEKIQPNESLQPFINHIWVIENDSSKIVQQKIIPDGYCELIFHYADPYRINLHGQWETQEKQLFAGQLTKHFFLENTGRSGMIGIKIHPVTGYFLFQRSMESYTDKVVSLGTVSPTFCDQLTPLTDPKVNLETKLRLVNQSFTKELSSASKDKTILQMVNDLFEANGLIDIKQLASSHQVSSRSLERHFKTKVGISAKRLARIIRLSHVFQLMKNHDRSWVEIALSSGHFDQSHFIRNFKEFTGEEPSSYGFAEKNMANFFLKK